jgi:hypothetical protein
MSALQVDLVVLELLLQKHRFGVLAVKNYRGFWL